MKTTNSRNKVSIFEKSCYGASGFGIGLTRNMIGIYLLFYYADVIGLSPAYISLAIMIGNVWDAITDPLMGFISDHTHTRWGRRRVYILGAALPLGVLVFLTWAPPSGLMGLPLFVYVSVLLAFLYAAFTVVCVPQLALGAELSSDADERSSIFGFSFAFTRFGELCGAIVPNVAIEFSDDIIRFLHAKAGLFSEEFTANAISYFSQQTNAFKWTAAFMGIVITLGAVTTFLGTHERVPHEPERRSLKGAQGFKTLYGDLFGTLKSRPFFLLLMAMTTIDIGSGITGSMMMFATEYWLKMADKVSLFYATYMAFAMGAAIFWVQFSKRTSKKMAYLLGQAILTVGLFATFFMAEGKFLRVFALLAFNGFGLGAYVMLWSLVADIVDYDEYATHKRREGAYYGVYTLFSKTAYGIGVFITGLYLKLIGFEKGVEITPEILFRIKLLFGPLTALINLAGVAIFFFFHYDKKEHEGIQRELALRKARLSEECAVTAGHNDADGLDR
ncbi:MFS transporter [Candidatus Poribacteria bacterium]|nr:MFS transporter [Candidatus Poribacteria bacterium]